MKTASSAKTAQNEKTEPGSVAGREDDQDYHKADCK
jgi:hypothetical protein